MIQQQWKGPLLAQPGLQELVSTVNVSRSQIQTSRPSKVQKQLISAFLLQSSYLGCTRNTPSFQAQSDSKLWAPTAKAMGDQGLAQSRGIATLVGQVCTGLDTEKKLLDLIWDLLQGAASHN